MGPLLGAVRPPPLGPPAPVMRRSAFVKKGCASNAARPRESPKTASWSSSVIDTRPSSAVASEMASTAYPEWVENGPEYMTWRGLDS